eukprot:TRINITY_DN3969_c0_g1_i1.p1 TRINITY_DN3969_c0_g1~~TRINITY_DN3969_c0_g1_i1.p1  ORF type:complete len:216 (-),score=12.94 TRINITY_DN3969_c0_g1_i1:478-1125(-)
MASPFSLRTLISCMLVVAVISSLPAEKRVEAQVVPGLPNLNIPWSNISTVLNDFFAALKNDSQSSFPGTKLWVLKSKPQYDEDIYGDDDDEDEYPQGEIEITKYSFNNIVSFKFEGEMKNGKKVKIVTIREGLPTQFGKPVLVVPGEWESSDGEYEMLSWIVDADKVAAYNGLTVTSVIDDIYASPYAYYTNMTTGKKTWVRAQFYKPYVCFWCG